jgi:hypothetical protein
MARKALIECSFLIPIRRDRNLSDGGLHRTTTWQWLDERLYEFGSATRATELYEGWYIDPDTNKAVKDYSRKYVSPYLGEESRGYAPCSVRCAKYFSRSAST